MCAPASILHLTQIGSCAACLAGGGYKSNAITASPSFPSVPQTDVSKRVFAPVRVKGLAFNGMLQYCMHKNSVLYA